jgi:hypothetical protein
MKFMCGTSTIGAHKTVVAVAHGQYLQELHQSNLKYCQVVVQVVHQVVTMITELAVKVAITA